jgi:hypothetical protein
MPPTPRALAALLLLAPACAEDSSFVLRWQVGRTADDAEQPLTTVRQCSDLGLSRVSVTTFADDRLTVEDTREFTCFPDEFTDPDGAAPGPELAAGTYFVTVLGLTRRGIPRPDPADEEEGVLARDQRKVVVDEKGQGVLVDGFRLVGIDECHDGIDNDRDGAIDDSDAPCRQGQAREDQDISGALFTFQAALLGGNPRATCAGLGIDRFRITLDGDDASVREIACTTVGQSFSADLPAGEHTWSAVGVAGDGEVVTAALTGEPFVVPSRDFVLVEIAVDFTLDTFLADPAFADPQLFAVEFMPYEGAPIARLCEPDDDLGALVLGAVSLTLEAAPLGSDAFAPVDTGVTLPSLMDAPFPVQAACTDFQQIRATSPLAWSAAGNARYRLVVEAEAAEPDGLGPCFSSADAPIELAPGVDIVLSVPRVRTDGACSDCPDGDECANCTDGVCTP